MLKDYLVFLDNYDGYFYESIPHILNSKQKWMFAYKNQFWTITNESNNSVEKVSSEKLIDYCQENFINLTIFESYLINNLIAVGMSLYDETRRKKDEKMYQEACNLVGEDLIKESYENLENGLRNIVSKIERRSKLSLV